MVANRTDTIVEKEVSNIVTMRNNLFTFAAERRWNADQPDSLSVMETKKSTKRNFPVHVWSCDCPPPKVIFRLQ